MPAVDVYHGDMGVYIRLNCRVDLSAAVGLYILVKNEAGTVTQLTAALDPFSDRHIRYLLPPSGSPFSTAPSGKDFVDYWLRSKIVWNELYPDGKQGKEVLLRVGKSWTAS